MANSNERTEIEPATASPTTPNGRPLQQPQMDGMKLNQPQPLQQPQMDGVKLIQPQPLQQPEMDSVKLNQPQPLQQPEMDRVFTAPPTIPNAGDELRWKKLSEYTTIVQNLSGRISSLQKSAFTLANYYFVSQAVVFTALSSNSSLVCHDVWFPLFLSLLPGALNLFAFFKIGQEYIETMISQKEYKKLRADLEVCMSVGVGTPAPVLNDENKKKREEKEKERLTGILYSCMCAFGFLAAVIAVGSLWMLCGGSIIVKHNAKCVKLCM